MIPETGITIFGYPVLRNLYLMEQLISPFDWSRAVSGSADELNTDAPLLWVWHADKVPPHVGISNEGVYFSLKVGGKDEAIAVQSLLELLQRKQIPTLCFELQTELQSLPEVFSMHDKAVPDEVTCLFPVREALRIPEAPKLSILLDRLFVEDKVKRVFGFHLPEGFNGIPEYDTQTIHQRLNELARKS